ncbi:hypothetical protein GQ44DRAFT_776007 [Phaeosphaeriaceae sp. PMI808]|nr:hypothetical protein GQ44DRAFT_776007 [Phaeosphaeriaceae sp. PMI808]
MSWAERRETKREEDAAYALLGIFDIHMPLIYGERQKKAFIRLRKEIQESPKDGSHAPPPALSSRPPKRRHGGDREMQNFQHNVVVNPVTTQMTLIASHVAIMGILPMTSIAIHAANTVIMPMNLIVIDEMAEIIW